LLIKMGIDYNPEGKYKDVNGDFLSKPLFTGCLN